jgi:hypothetical protein
VATAAGTQPVRFTGSITGQSGITLSSEGVLTGTPATPGTFMVTAIATDGGGRTATRSLPLTISATEGPVISSGPLLPVAGFGKEISYYVEANEGIRPYSWAIISGSLPPGVTFDPTTGLVAGSTQSEGVFRFTVRVTDANGRIDLRVLELPVTQTGEELELTTQSLPTAILGRPYRAALEVQGGKGPYVVLVISGSPPPGLRVTDNVIEGTPMQPATTMMTLQVTDAFGYTVTRDFAVRVDFEQLPTIEITGLPDRINPGQQVQLNVQSNGVYPVRITGRLEADFAPEPAIAGVDPALQFSTGGRQVDFRIEPDQTRATFPGGVLAMQTGTVAGAITLKLVVNVADQSVITPNRPDRTVRIVHLAPVISSAALERRTNGFTINLTGFSSTREVSEAVVVLTPVPGRELQATRYSIALTETFRAWYTNSASFPFGTQFRLALPFDGDASVIQSLSVQLRNSEGASEERRITF